MGGKISFTLLVVAMLACNTDYKKSSESSVEDKMNLLFSELYSKKEFNGNILVIRKGVVLFEKSFGYADVAKNYPLSKGFRFGIGSIYKEFPAVAIMQLMEANKLSLGDKVQKFLPTLPDWSAQITIKNLLQYSSGLPKIDFGKYFSKDKIISEEAIWADIMSLEKLDFHPGSSYLYSNNNPFLLIKIVEEVSNKKFVDYAQEKLFTPGNMKNTVFKKQYPFIDKTSMANPFNASNEQDEFGLNVSSLLLCATAEDLHKWLEALHSYKLINVESLKILTETVNPEKEGQQAPLGNCQMKENKIVEHYHHGSMGNYECLIQRFNLENLSILIMTNQKNSNVFEIAEEIREIISYSN